MSVFFDLAICQHSTLQMYAEDLYKICTSRILTAIQSVRAKRKKNEKETNKMSCNRVMI